MLFVVGVSMINVLVIRVNHSKLRTFMKVLLLEHVLFKQRLNSYFQQFVQHVAQEFVLFLVLVT